MGPKYGKDYGIKVDVPWYIKCPLINRLFNTCLVDIKLTTFTHEGAPLIGVCGKFRIPIEKRSRDITSMVQMSYALPQTDDVLQVAGFGVHVDITLLDVNYAVVLSTTEDIPLRTSFFAVPKTDWVRLGEWNNLAIDLKFGNKDYYEI